MIPFVIDDDTVVMMALLDAECIHDWLELGSSMAMIPSEGLFVRTHLLDMIGLIVADMVAEAVIVAVIADAAAIESVAVSDYEFDLDSLAVTRSDAVGAVDVAVGIATGFEFDTKNVMRKKL